MHALFDISNAIRDNMHVSELDSWSTKTREEDLAGIQISAPMLIYLQRYSQDLVYECSSSLPAFEPSSHL
jgi:hypothetical protein